MFRINESCFEKQNIIQQKEKYNPRLCITYSFQSLQLLVTTLKEHAGNITICVSGIKVTNDTTANMSVHRGAWNTYTKCLLDLLDVKKKDCKGVDQIIHTSRGKKYCLQKKSLV